MITTIARLTGISTLGVWAAMLALAAAGVWAWGGYRHHAGFREGQAIERVAWEKATRDLREQMDAERRKAQLRIDEIEQDYLKGRQRDAVLIADLEAAIAQMETDDAETDNHAGPVCRPAIPRGLSRQLDAIGR
ncbi:hypothetical protein [Shinella sp. NM-101]|uniref:hypothetical protein n=1 Tax=Shinella sp. NM-101 TaxID=2744455 RepID=UPI001F44A10F|nr:hypothetical protein [Shinella sp. NM-101]